MRQNNGKKSVKTKFIKRAVIGLAFGGVIGYAAAYIAGAVGSQCMILCNQAVAIPYFAVIGLLVAWR